MSSVRTNALPSTSVYKQRSFTGLSFLLDRAFLGNFSPARAFPGHARCRMASDHGVATQTDAIWDDSRSLCHGSLAFSAASSGGRVIAPPPIEHGGRLVRDPAAGSSSRAGVDMPKRTCMDKMRVSHARLHTHATATLATGYGCQTHIRVHGVPPSFLRAPRLGRSIGRRALDRCWLLAHGRNLLRATVDV